MLHMFLAAVGFAGFAYGGAGLGFAVCKDVAPFEDGPRPGKPCVAALALAAALLGAFLSYRGLAWTELACAGLLILALAAAWVSDVVCGLLPDVFTLLPLAIAATVRAYLHQWDYLLAGVLVFLPFAIAAWCSDGRGMGWGDVKLAALGGVILGTYLAICSFLSACIVALLITWLRGRKNEPIAFGPYLAGAIGTALTMGIGGL